ncbi:MAG: undecaprenyldiphospho-muramoylpentapeptide beta-N-acetylglucosaminyltransferase [Ruminococcaceae bacterium]|nr:undecaprenyldiphospho-muramoylpentapeptide beta-N-acetylglucosaminyltransferase [Oscillospiraceae bacterium]
MNVIFTCGGTGGHINPAIAVANLISQRNPGCNILFIGAKGHMEEQLVPKAGYRLECLPGSGLSRGISLSALKKNMKAVKCVFDAVSQCKKIIREFQPDVIVGTGGYASFPALYAGHKLGVPTCVHEANAVPGLTTKLAANLADRVLVCFEESRKHYKHPDKVEVVGMPIREEFWETDRQKARQELGVGERPLLVSTFGSQGAKAMNEMVVDLFAIEQKEGFPFHHIHAVGSFGWKWMPERVKEKGVALEQCPTIDMREYIYNMPTVLAAADVVIGRAGSGTCNEIAATGTPCILIPSPNVTNNHQEKNARVLEAGGGAIVLLEKDCSPERIFGEAVRLMKDAQAHAQMSQQLRSMAVRDSADRICRIAEGLAEKKKS